MFKLEKMSTWGFEAVSFLIITGLIIGSWTLLQFVGSNNQTIQRTALDSAVLANSEFNGSNTPATLSDLLADTFYSVQKNKAGRYSISVTKLDDRQTASLNADNHLKAASLYKLFVASEALKMTEQGLLSMDDTVDTERNMSVRECIEIMIKDSDNDCGLALQTATKPMWSNPYTLKKQGFNNTTIDGIYPTTTAEDIDTFYKNLTDRSYLSEENALFLESQLAAQTINDRIPSLLPDGAAVSHKTADLEGYIHDAGIVYGKNTNYSIVIMSQPQSGSQPERYAEIAEISKAIYEKLN